MFKLGALTFLIIVFQNCTPSPIGNEASFYYWKNSAYYLSDSESMAIQRNEIRNLYVRFFDVTIDPAFGPLPVAKQNLHLQKTYYSSTLNDSLLQVSLKNLNIIPTVYIQNKVLKQINTNRLDSLANNIVFLIQKYYAEKMQRPQPSLNEIQIDCDWTISTKENYFTLLRLIRIYARTGLSCTLRLYPYKYPDKMGVPPVDRVTLMCYNLLNPFEEKERNSILEQDELSKYLKGTKRYPLKTDIALPLFSWMHVYQFNRLVLMEPLSDEILNLTKHKQGLWYELVKDTVWGDHYLRKGDAVKFETIKYAQLVEVLDLVKHDVPLDEGFRLTLFHLDENTLNRFTHAEVHSVFNAFD